MCSGSERKVTFAGAFMEGDNATLKNDSMLLELAAAGDLESFKHAVEEEGYALDESSSWYVRRIGSKEMGLEERTPLMVAALFGNKDVLAYILETGHADVNRSSGSDGTTALHCAAAGGSCLALEIVKLLIDASADINSVDVNGSKPGDVITQCPNSSSKWRRKSLQILLKAEFDDQEGGGGNKKEYPVDPSLPDIKNGVYSTDEFRKYAFKVKPCSRAYSHDWTECPFAHPGENARRRDPGIYHYSCVPCPEFKKGCCSKGDTCEYAHGIFECWLHPAQYRTRLCKDEINCSRRVCFFAHKVEELRPLYPSTGSAVLSPRSMVSVGGGYPFDMLHSTSTPPLTPTGVSPSPCGSMWQNHLNIITPPPLQLPGSRLQTTLNARNAGFEADLVSLENQIRRQQLLEELVGLNMNSPVRSSSPFGMDPSMVMNPRSAAFAKRSQSFIDHGAVNRLSGFSSPTRSPTIMHTQPHLSDWGSPDGKLDWGIQGEELNKLRKSASFGFRNFGNPNYASGAISIGNSAVGHVNPEEISFDNNGGSETIPYWVEQYLEQEQLVA